VKQIPKLVQVGAFTFEVRCKQGHMNRKRLDADQASRIGNADYWRQTLDIAPDVADDQKRVTLLHEVIHACYMAGGRSNSAELGEEAVIEFLAPMLLDTLRRNPDVAAYLLAVTA
jgi:hypothetical protein